MYGRSKSSFEEHFTIDFKQQTQTQIRSCKPTIGMFPANIIATVLFLFDSNLYLLIQSKSLFSSNASDQIRSTFSIFSWLNQEFLLIDCSIIVCNFAYLGFNLSNSLRCRPNLIKAFICSEFVSICLVGK